MINTFRIGADPEFVMVNDENVLHVWPDYEGEIRVIGGTAGPDHGGAVAELRPIPAIGTYALVKRIGNMLTSDAWGNHRDFRWLAGPVQTVVNTDHDECEEDCVCHDEGHKFTQPLGGHIHLDIRANNPQWDSIVEALDAQHMLFERLELYPQDQCDMRRNEGYGKFKWVTCNNAGNENDDEWNDRYEKPYLDKQVINGYKDAAKYHMEFRTPPSWLYHPRISMLALTSAKLAAADPEGTIDALHGKPICLNTLKSWYERYKGKDVNADRVLERILHKKSIHNLQFDTNNDLKDVWSTIDF